MTHVWIALPFMALGWLLLGSVGRGLGALTLGEDAASAMGISLPRLRHPLKTLLPQTTQKLERNLTTPDSVFSENQRPDGYGGSEQQKAEGQ